MRAVVAPMMADRLLYQSIRGLLDAMPEPLRDEANRIRFAPHHESIARCHAILHNWEFDQASVKPALAPTIPHHCSDEFLIALFRRRHRIAYCRIKIALRPRIAKGKSFAVRLLSLPRSVLTEVHANVRLGWELPKGSYRYFPTKDQLIDRIYQEVYLSNWNPRWESRLRDRSAPLEKRLTDFYIDYARAI
jgi:hypothetical protein